MSRRVVMPKYYILDSDTQKVVRVISRKALEEWMLRTPPNELLLASDQVGGVLVQTHFKGVVYGDEGLYETTVSSASSGQPRVVKRYPGLSSDPALTGHMGIVNELETNLVHD